ncbi:MAG: Na+:solute symporter [Bacteroidales bacterium]|nr:Na+:solute symporter [Bacteroidales bacterium]
MGTLDLMTVAIFSVAVLVTGISLSRTGKDMKGFFGGGGNVPWGMSGLSLFMGFFSAGTFVVWGSLAYSHGLVAIIIQLTMCLAGFAVGTFVAGKWQQTGCLTAAEYATERLGEKTQKAYTYIFLAVSIFTTGSFLYPVAKIIEVAAGVPLTTSILVLGIFCIIYVSLGGLRGVMVTDVLQFVILMAAVVIAIPLSFGKVGGVGEFLEKVPEGFFRCFNDEYSPLFIFAFCIYNAVFLGGNWAYVQRYTAVKGTSSARKVGWLFGALYIVSPVLWMLPPMIYRIYNPGLEGLENENAYLLMCKEALPYGFLGMMLGGMIFATASSLNSTLNISAGVFTNDIYRKLRPESSQKHLMRMARMSTIFFGLLAIVVALLVKSMGGIVNVVISVAALTGVPLYLPLIWSLYSRRQNGRTLMGVTLSSLTVNLLFKFVTPLFGLSLGRGMEMLVGTMVPVLMLTVIEIVLAKRGYVDPMASEYAGKAAEGRTDDVGDGDGGAADGEETNRFTSKVLGISITAAGAAILVLGLISPAKAVPVTVASAVLLLGLVILIRNRK